MFYNYSIEKLVGLQDIEVKNIETSDSDIRLFCRMKRKPHKCPACGNLTNRIHDYRVQVIKDCPVLGKNFFICLEKRRYICSCSKRFYEKVSFIPRYHRMTHRLVCNIIDALKSTLSFTDVSKRFNVSVSTVIRIFDFVSFKKPELSNVVSIDEFKGNVWGEKYQCILTDPVNHKMLDILPNRFSYSLASYFKTLDGRENVHYFVSDMWRTYESTAKIFFKNADTVVDKYHWIRQVFWAFERVRKDIQKTLSKEYRIYFKHSKRLLMKRYSKLREEQKQQINVMLSLSPTLSSAYFIKEDFLKVLDCKNREQAKKHLIEWIDYARDSSIASFQKCANTIYSWLTGILNSFDCPYTNGFTEGCNNKIKVLKRNAYGYRNFIRFRKRILHIFS